MAARLPLRQAVAPAPGHPGRRGMSQALVRVDYETWRQVTGRRITDAGQHEMLNWFCLLGALSEGGLRLAWSAFVTRDFFNSNKYLAIYHEGR